MYGRLVEVEGVDSSKRDEILADPGAQSFRVKEIEGFAGFISLTDAENNRAPPLCSGRRRKAERRSGFLRRSARRWSAALGHRSVG